MPTPPSLVINPAFEVVDFDPATLNIITPTGRYSLADQSGLMPELVRAAAGGLELSRFVASHSDRYPSHQVETAAASLMEKRILVPSERKHRPDPLLDFVSSLSGRAPGSAPSSLAWRIDLAGNGDLADHLAAVLEKLGIAVKRLDPAEPLPAASPDSLLVACSDHDEFSRFRTVNAAAVAAGRPAYYLSTDRHLVRAGPLVLPHATACIECLYHRVASTRLFHAEFVARSEPERRLSAPRPSLFALHQAAACLPRALLFLAGSLSDAHLGPLHEYDTLKGSLRVSQLLRLPRCAICGAAQERPSSEVFQAARVRRSLPSHDRAG